MATNANKQALPPKEQQIFKKIVKHYEHKQYKLGLKLAKQILSTPKFSEHGETLCMKGLILNSMGKREEGQADVKLGLRCNLTSHVCWHVYGLIQRSNKKYEDAIKAYRNALKFDKDNLQILRDLALLQVQMRDLDGYKESKYRYLVLRPTQRVSWLGYAIACHLLCDYDLALKTLSQYREHQTEIVDSEQSELILYTVMIQREAGRLDDALQTLNENTTLIHDKEMFLREKGELLIEMQRKDEAEKIYEQLLRRNADNAEFYHAIERCRGIRTDHESQADETNTVNRLQIYDTALKYNKFALYAKFAPLTFLRESSFLSRIKDFLLSGCRRGTPSAFRQLRPLYDNRLDRNKVIIIENTLMSWASSLEKYSRLPNDKGEEPSLDEPEESPTVVLWVYYYLAEHFNRIQNGEKALHFINRAMSHTPTLIELQMEKASILRRMGDHSSAAVCMERAQDLDTADRYINSKCAKYMLRANMVQEAVHMCGKFTREGVDAEQNLDEMQCMWYQTMAAKAHRRLGNLADALKLCHQVERHFASIVEDQYDFHTYCLRKSTLKAYVRLLRCEDNVRDHQFYANAAQCAIKIYLILHDRVSAGGTGDAKSADASEQRKAARKAKKAKAQQQALKAEQDKAEQARKRNEKKDPEDEAVMAPLDGDKLVSTETPLEDAANFASALLTTHSPYLKSQLRAFEVYLRMKKPLLMLQSLSLAKQAAQSSNRLDDGNLHVAYVKMLMFCRHDLDALYPDDAADDGEQASPPATTRQCIDELLPKVLPSLDASLLNKEYLDANRNQLSAHIAYMHAQQLIGEKTGEWRQNWLSLMDTQRLTSFPDCSWKLCKKAAKLTRQYAPEQYASTLKPIAALYPHCNWLQHEARADLANGIADLSIKS